MNTQSVTSDGTTAPEAIAYAIEFKKSQNLLFDFLMAIQNNDRELSARLLGDVFERIITAKPSPVIEDGCTDGSLIVRRLK